MVESGFAGILLSVVFMSITASLMWAFPKEVSAVITTEESVLELASQLIIIAGFFQIVDGIQAVAAGALRGLGLTRFSSIANLTGHWAFGLPLGLWLAFEKGYGVVGLWWGLTSGLSAVALALTWKFVQVSRKDISSFQV
jgi:MATE family multidrug resistance protein